MNKITYICLGVKNMEKALKFYRNERVFQTDEKSNNPDVIFFNTPGTKFELFPLELLAKDITIRKVNKSYTKTLIDYYISETVFRHMLKFEL